MNLLSFVEDIFLLSHQKDKNTIENCEMLCSTPSANLLKIFMNTLPNITQTTLSQYFHRHYITVTTPFSNIYFHINTTSSRSINPYEHSYSDLIHNKCSLVKKSRINESINILFFTNKYTSLSSKPPSPTPQHPQLKCITKFRYNSYTTVSYTNTSSHETSTSTNQTIGKYQHRINRTQAATSSTTHHHCKHCNVFDRDPKLNKMHHIDPNQTSTSTQLEQSHTETNKTFHT